MKRSLSKTPKYCEKCRSEFFVRVDRAKIARFCSIKCARTGISNRKGISNGNMKSAILLNCEACEKQFSVRPHRANKARFCSTLCSRGYLIGEKSFKWIKDRSKLLAKQIRNDSAYQGWRKAVLKRDSNRCKIEAPSCEGKLVAHHILPWAKFPEFRYDLNNGITLCKAHHPKRRDEEMQLSPYFQEVLVRNENYAG